MPQEILDYTPEYKRFFFYSNSPQIHKIHGLERLGSSWSFTERYPDSYLALKQWKSITNGRATNRALEKINEVKSIVQKIENLEEISKYKNLFQRDPYVHQLEVTEYMLHYDRLGVILEQGLGKTFIVLMYLQIMRLPTLVLAPKIALRNWYREIQDFTDFNPVIYRGTATQRHQLRQQILNGDLPWDIIITNYETLVASKSVSKNVVLDWWDNLDEKQKLKFIEAWRLPKEIGDIKLKKDLNYAWTYFKNLPEKAFLRPDVLRRKAWWDDLEFLKKLNYQCVIFDEGSRLKGNKSKRSKAALDLAEQVEKRYILSGTLCLGDPRDVFMPMRIINHRIFGMNYKSFEKNYCNFSPYNKHIVTEFKNLDTLKNKMDPFIIAKKREDCISLPDRIFTKVFYELTEYQNELYNEIVEDKHTLSIVKLNKLRQVLSGHLIEPDYKAKEKCNECPHLLECVEFQINPWDKQCIEPIKKPDNVLQEFYTPKLDALKETLEFSDEKAIIWYYYRYDRKQIETLLRENNYSFVHADEDNCDYKFEQGNYNVFLGQINQGIAITLNSATQTIYYSHGLGLEPRLQSLDRNHRMGQKKSVLVKDFICPESVEESTVKLLNDKEDVKNFIQSKQECKQCEHSMKCFALGIEPYTEKCIHYTQRLNAEEKKHIKISKVK